MFLSSLKSQVPAIDVDEHNTHLVIL